MNHKKIPQKSVSQFVHALRHTFLRNPIQFKWGIFAHFRDSSANYIKH